MEEKLTTIQDTLQQIDTEDRAQFNQLIELINTILFFNDLKLEIKPLNEQLATLLHSMKSLDNYPKEDSLLNFFSSENNPKPLSTLLKNYLEPININASNELKTA